MGRYQSAPLPDSGGFAGPFVSRAGGLPRIRKLSAGVCQPFLEFVETKREWRNLSVTLCVTYEEIPRMVATSFPARCADGICTRTELAGPAGRPRLLRLPYARGWRKRRNPFPHNLVPSSGK